LLFNLSLFTAAYFVFFFLSPMIALFKDLKKEVTFVQIFFEFGFG
jgi:hypothetical protein